MSQLSRGQCLVGKRILVVDDSPDISVIYARVLQHDGAQVDTASGVLAGMDLTRQQSYDAVLMDLEMLDIGGLAGVAMLRQDGYRGLVLALTGHSEPSIQATGMAQGFDGFMAKDGDWAGLIDHISRLISGAC